MPDIVSIIIPTYNSERTIGKCLESVISQKYQGKKEIIVVDDGSTDNTKSTVSAFPVTYLKQQKKGPAVARNLGARNAKGDVLVFLDADCVASDTWLQEMVSPFVRGVTGVQGAYKTTQKELTARFAQLEIENRYERMKSKDTTNFIGSYSAAYQRDTFLKNNGFYEGFSKASGEDPDLSFRLAKQGHILVFNPKAVVFHQHPDSLSKYIKQKFSHSYWRILLYKRNKDTIVKESYTPQTLKLQIILFYLLVVTVLLSGFSSISARISILILTLLIVSTLPESFKNFRKDMSVGIISPILLILRTITFSIGLIAGTLQAPSDKN